MTRRVVLATHNEHKVKELREILAASSSTAAGPELEVVSMGAFPEVGEIPETEVTFAGNARLKAEHVARVAVATEEIRERLEGTALVGAARCVAGPIPRRRERVLIVVCRGP